MNKGLLLALVVALIAVVALTASAIGDTTSVAPIVDPQLNEPAQDSGVFSSILAPFKWAYNAIKTFVGLFDFAPNMPSELVAVIVVPVLVVILATLFAYIRGG